MCRSLISTDILILLFFSVYVHLYMLFIVKVKSFMYLDCLRFNTMPLINSFTHRTKPSSSHSGTSPTTVIEMDTVSSKKPLLTDAEINLFREISREEFKNFKTSNSYSLFKGKSGTHKSQATLDIKEITQPSAKAEAKSSVASSKDSKTATGRSSLTDTLERKSSTHASSSKAEAVKTPTKKSSSAESVSLPQSPTPVFEKNSVLS